MPKPKLQKVDVEAKKLHTNGGAQSVVWLQRDPTGPALDNHTVKATSAAGCVWRGTVVGQLTADVWKAKVSFVSGSCVPPGPVSRPPTSGGGGGGEDISVTVTNPTTTEESNTEIAVQVEIVP